MRLLSRSHPTVGIAVAMTLAAAMVAWPGVAAASSAAPASRDAIHAVIAAARSHVGAPYQFGGTGPGYDCSGLVYRVFKDTHELKRIGGKRMSAAALLHWFEARGMASSRSGEPGDLVIYGHGGHVGIYIGRGKVISAVIHGVRQHRLHGLTIKFTVFLHTRLRQEAPAPSTVAGLFSLVSRGG